MNWEEFIAAWDEGRRDFSNVNFSKAGVYSYHEKSINFEEANFTRANFTGADLQGLNLQGANFQKTQLQGASLDGTNLQEANLIGANLQNANLQMANLQGAHLRATDFRQADLKAADLQGAHLNVTKLQRADLQEANLQEANLQEANLYSANLQEANLKDANLDRANLSRANLCSASLTEATLEKANLEGARLHNACLKGANLQEANLQYANIESIGIDSSTQFFNEGFTQNSQGQFYPIQGSIAEQNKQLLKTLDSTWLHISFKSTEQLLLELIHFCQSNPQSTKAQTFYQHAPWTKVICRNLSGNSVDAFIPFGTKLNPNGSLSTIHGTELTIPLPQVSADFWDAHKTQSDETHEIYLASPLDEEDEVTALFIGRKPLHDMPDDIQQALHEEVQNPGKHKDTSIRGIAIAQFFDMTSWNTVEKEALGIQEPEAGVNTSPRILAQPENTVASGAPTSSPSRLFDTPPPNDEEHLEHDTAQNPTQADNR